MYNRDVMKSISETIGVRYQSSPQLYRKLYSKELWRRRKPKIESNRKELISLMGGECVRCGKKSRLEIDHKDRKTMTFRLSGDVLVRKWEECLIESKKCQLLCRNCHALKSYKETGNLLEKQRRTAKHGSITMYCNHKCRCEACRHAWAKYQKAKRSNP
jgi:hypothetical protein